MRERRTGRATNRRRPLLAVLRFDNDNNMPNKIMSVSSWSGRALHRGRRVLGDSACSSHRSDNDPAVGPAQFADEFRCARNNRARARAQTTAAACRRGDFGRHCAFLAVVVVGGGRCCCLFHRRHRCLLEPGRSRPLFGHRRRSVSASLAAAGCSLSEPSRAEPRPN